MHSPEVPHDVPSGLSGLLQFPVTSSHVPTKWHPLSATHVTGVPEHSPSSHTAPVLQGPATHMTP
jgi:hypothetical protein